MNVVRTFIESLQVSKANVEKIFSQKLWLVKVLTSIPHHPRPSLEKPTLVQCKKIKKLNNKKKKVKEQSELLITYFEFVVTFESSIKRIDYFRLLVT